MRYKPTDSFGVPVEECSQIILFRNEQVFNDVLAANPHLCAVFGKEEHEKQAFPGVYIAGIKAN